LQPANGLVTLASNLTGSPIVEDHRGITRFVRYGIFGSVGAFAQSKDKLVVMSA
jgi:hypothetical protein